MADPLSIAGSVVGITAAGVQASIKLYAIAEKVVTASQRVRSIADDISSTCAILNQVRELIIPQPDAQGTLKSVFKSNALGDISHALRRCRSVFTEIEALLSNAFEQVRDRSTPHSKIELSKFEKAKWPFLQPQFDDLRDDLRGAKGDLVLMIAVASLALAQRNGRHRPVHDRERLDLGSAIVQLQRARTIKQQDRNTAERSQDQKRSLRKLFGMRKNDDTDEHMMLERNRGMDSTRVSASGSLNPTTASPRGLLQDAGSSTLIKDWAHGVTPTDVRVSPEDTSKPSIAEGETILATLGSRLRPLKLKRRNVPVASHSPGKPASSEPDALDHSSLPVTTASPPLFVSTAVVEPPQEQPEATVPTNVLPSIASGSNETRHYQGWVTNYREGLSTGHGDSLSLDRLELPDPSLETLVETYFEEGHDLHIALSELTEQQRKLIHHSCLELPNAEVAYVNVQHKFTVHSVFGVLKIDTLKWVVVSRSRLRLKDVHRYSDQWIDVSEVLGNPNIACAENPVLSGDLFASILRRQKVSGHPVMSSAHGLQPKDRLSQTNMPSPADASDSMNPDEQMSSSNQVASKQGGGFHPSIPVSSPAERPWGKPRGSMRDTGYGGNLKVPTTIPGPFTGSTTTAMPPLTVPQHHTPGTGSFFKFRRNRNNAQPPDVELALHAENEEDNGDEEDEIVNELLARWTTS